MSNNNTCKICETLRCCTDHCCDWDSCQCGDCKYCYGDLPVEYTQAELEKRKNLRIANEKSNKNDNDDLNKVNGATLIISESNLEGNIVVNKMSSQEPNKDNNNSKTESKEEKDKTIEMLLNYKFSSTEDENKRHEETKKIIEDTKLATTETINKIDQTLENIRKTLVSVKETNDKFEQLKIDTVNKDQIIDPYYKPNEKMVGFGNYYPDIDDDDYYTAYFPEISDIDTVAELILMKTNIVILTGPEIVSGQQLPTIRGQNGFFTLKNKEKIKAEEFLTLKFFKENPNEIWKWHYNFKTTIFNSQPNNAHFALAYMQSYCKEANINLTLATQNIDNLHIDAYIQTEAKNTKNYFEESKGVVLNPNQDAQDYGICNDIYELNGNINYMRCQNSCVPKLFSSPMTGIPADYIPKCPKCKGLARPHTLFYDEQSSETYYRSDTLKNRAALADCLILIGNILDFEISNTIISQAISNNALIVEITMQPKLEIGNVKQLIGFTEEIVPSLCLKLQERLTKYTNKEK